MAEIDELLSSTLKRVAQPGDPAGVADAIRSRVDAGDTGTPAASSGFGGGLLSWLPWVGLVVVAGLVGGTVGATGVLGATGQQIAPEPVSVLTVGSLVNSVDASGCPGGDPLVSLESGQRVLGIVRTDDSGWLGVRDPLSLGRTVWLPSGLVELDAGQPAIDTLPIGGCPEPVVAADTAPPAPVVPDPAPAPDPGPAPPPVPQPGDTTPPSVLQAWGAPNPFYNASPVTINAIVGDDVGVVAVLISWSGAVNGSGSMSPVGGDWAFTFSTTEQSFGPVTFTMRAVDAAGNQSAPVQVVVSHSYFG